MKPNTRLMTWLATCLLGATLLLAAGCGGEAPDPELQSLQQAIAVPFPLLPPLPGGGGEMPGELPFCGNKVVEWGEQCDGYQSLGSKTCKSLGYFGGNLTCSSSCKYNTSSCYNLPTPDPGCGDGVINPMSESCDGSNFGGKTCQSYGFSGGTLSCDNNKCVVKTSNCSRCGDNKLNSGEACDGGNLAGKTCQSLGYNGGSLSCTSSCTFNTNSCTWAKTLGEQAPSNQAVAAHSSGNTYVTGQGAVAHRLAPNGQRRWTRRGSPSTMPVNGRDIATDAAGNIYVTGYYHGKPQLGSTSLPDTGGKPSLFVAKLNSAGAYLWVRWLSAPASAEFSGSKIAVRGSDVVVAGRLKGGAWLFGKYRHSAGGALLVAKLGTNGAWKWATVPTGWGTLEADGVALDPWGNVFVTSTYSGNWTFGNVNLVAKNGGWNVMLAKLTAAGAWSWARGLYATTNSYRASYVIAEDLAVDSSGNAYLLGTFRGRIWYGWPFYYSASRVSSSTWSSDAFVLKVAGNGPNQWLSTDNKTSPRAIALDSAGNAFYTGRNTSELLPTIKKLTYNGALVWTKDATSKTFQNYRPGPEGIALGGNGKVFVTGTLSGSVTFGLTTLSSTSSATFVWKLATP